MEIINMVVVLMSRLIKSTSLVNQLISFSLLLMTMDNQSHFPCKYLAPDQVNANLGYTEVIVPNIREMIANTITLLIEEESSRKQEVKRVEKVKVKAKRVRMAVGKEVDKEVLTDLPIPEQVPHIVPAKGVPGMGTSKENLFVSTLLKGMETDSTVAQRNLALTHTLSYVVGTRRKVHAQKELHAHSCIPMIHYKRKAKPNPHPIKAPVKIPQKGKSNPGGMLKTADPQADQDAGGKEERGKARTKERRMGTRMSAKGSQINQINHSKEVLK